jgi:hypothetical protein
MLDTLLVFAPFLISNSAMFCHPERSATCMHRQECTTKQMPSSPTEQAVTHQVLAAQLALAMIGADAATNVMKASSIFKQHSWGRTRSSTHGVLHGAGKPKNVIKLHSPAVPSCRLHL